MDSDTTLAHQLEQAFNSFDVDRALGILKQIVDKGMDVSLEVSSTSIASSNLVRMDEDRQSSSVRSGGLGQGDPHLLDSDNVSISLENSELRRAAFAHQIDKSSES